MRANTWQAGAPKCAAPHAFLALFAVSISCKLPMHEFQAVVGFKAVLRPGRGVVVVRDYAVGDVAELRLAAKGRQKKLAAHFYLRGDGTRCLYFSEVRVPTRVTVKASWCFCACCRTCLPCLRLTRKSSSAFHGR